MNQAELTAITPLTLLTNPYANNADIPNFRNDSILKVFSPPLNMERMLDRNDLLSASDSIWEVVREVVVESISTAGFVDCCSSSLGSSLLVVDSSLLSLVLENNNVGAEDDILLLCISLLLDRVVVVSVIMATEEIIPPEDPGNCERGRVIVEAEEEKAETKTELFVLDRLMTTIMVMRAIIFIFEVIPVIDTGCFFGTAG